jgi:hypothetical protein
MPPRGAGANPGKSPAPREQQFSLVTQTYFLIYVSFQLFAKYLSIFPLTLGLRWNQQDCRGKGNPYSEDAN